jgi:flagellar basal body rod protein FlgG
MAVGNYQANNLATISENISNASTTGYKQTELARV